MLKNWPSGWSSTRAMTVFNQFNIRQAAGAARYSQFRGGGRAHRQGHDRGRQLKATTTEANVSPAIRPATSGWYPICSSSVPSTLPEEPSLLMNIAVPDAADRRVDILHAPDAGGAAARFPSASRRPACSTNRPSPSPRRRRGARSRRRKSPSWSVSARSVSSRSLADAFARRADGRRRHGQDALARAIAGEAKVPFFSISGSDFVEMLSAWARCACATC